MANVLYIIMMVKTHSRLAQAFPLNMVGEWVGGRDAGCPGWGGAASIVFACSARMGGWVSPKVGPPLAGRLSVTCV